MSTQTQISRPAPFVEQLGTELGKQVIAQQGIPLVAQTVAGLGAAPTQRTGETAEQFKLRQDLFKRRQDAAQMFEDRKVFGALAPQVAATRCITKTSTNFSTSTSRCYRYSIFSTIFNTSPNTSRISWRTRNRGSWNIRRYIFRSTNSTNRHKHLCLRFSNKLLMLH